MPIGWSSMSLQGILGTFDSHYEHPMHPAIGSGYKLTQGT